MIRREVILSPEALDDLSELMAWISETASPQVAVAYVGTVRSYLAGFDIASERGAARDDISAGLRVIGFKRRLTIWFTSTDREVHILRVFRAGQDWALEL